MILARVLAAAFGLVLVAVVTVTAACGAPATVHDPAPLTDAAGGGPTSPGLAITPSPLNEAEQPPITVDTAATPTASPSPAPAPPPVPAGPPPPRRARDLPPPPLGALAAVVVDGDSGAVLFEKDAHIPLPPASTTKIMTALLALERGNLDDVIEVTLDGRTYWGSVMGLRSGDRFTLRDLLYGLMLPSGNDAAYVIAVHLAGSEREFAGQMTARMRELGLTESSFINASGLGRGDSNLTSAHDLAQLARYAMSNPRFAALVNTRAWTARGSRAIAMTNGNGLLYAYRGADGVKIGFGGRSAGNTIVGSATRNGHRLVVTLLNVPNRDAEAAALLDWAFATYTWDGAGSSP